MSHSCWQRGAALIVLTAVILPDGRLSRLLRRKPLVVLGRISYGVYIIHYPVVRVTEHWVRSSKRPIGWPESLLIASLSIGVSLLLAAISWRFLERPILSLKRAFSSVSEESHEHGG